MNITDPGIYDISFSDYLSDPCPEPSVSRTAIHTMLTKTPMHVYREHPRLGGKNRSRGRRADFGTAAHDMVLTHGKSIHVIQATDKNGEKVKNYLTKAAKVERDNARDLGFTPVLSCEYKNLLEMIVNAGGALSDIGVIADYDTVEKTMIWKEGDVWCKARPDIVDKKGTRLIDYKTTSCADQPTWTRRTMYPGGYDIQAAWYIRGAKALLGGNWSFLFMLQEMEDPYLTSMVVAGASLLRHANEKIDRAVAKWKTCLDAGKWGAYGSDAYVADVPAYELQDWSERERAD